MAGKKSVKFFSSKEERRTALQVLVLIAAFFALLAILSYPLLPLFKDAVRLRAIVQGFGFFGPAFFILLQVLQVLIAPVPGQAAGFVSGYIFGVFPGTVYTMIGTTIGSYIAFILARKFGRPFVEKAISKSLLKKFDYVSKSKGVFALFLIFLLPALPDDAICFIAGLTKIRIRVLVLIAFLGRLPGFFILNLVGNGMALSQWETSVIIFSLMIFVSLIIFLFRKQLEDHTNNIIKNNFKGK